MCFVQGPQRSDAVGLESNITTEPLRSLELLYMYMG